MTSLKEKFKKINKSCFLLAGVALLLLLAIFLLWFNNYSSIQSFAPMVAQVYFDGEYQIEGGEWHKIVNGEHIPATKGDVTLRGNFHMKAPDGEYVGIYRGEVPIAFYLNHINLTFYESGTDPFIVDINNPIYGASLCGRSWTALTFMSDSEEPIEIFIHNPHVFGNETAIDEMLSSIAFWSGIEFEKSIEKTVFSVV